MKKYLLFVFILLSSFSYSQITSQSKCSVYDNNSASVTPLSTDTILIKRGAITSLKTTLDLLSTATGGITSLSSIGAIPNANGGTITGNVFNLQPASILFGGAVTTTTQSFVGDKTLTSKTFFDNGTGRAIFQADATITADPTLYMFNNQATVPTATNYILKVGSANSGNTILQGNAILIRMSGTSNGINITNQTLNFTSSGGTGGSTGTYFFGAVSKILQTASTEQIHFNIFPQTTQFNTGAIATQRSTVIQAPTYSFTGASTITNSATFAVTGSPIASTNATLTNRYSIWVQSGDSRFDGTNLIANHLKGGTASPTITAGAGAGTTPTVSLSNATDISGIVNVTTGTATPTGVIATITFNTPYGVAPNIVLSDHNQNTSTLGANLRVFTTSTTTTFVINSGSSSLASSTAYSWYYQIVQ